MPPPRIGEVFAILSGAATLGSPEKFRTVMEGNVVFFEEGPSGAHQLLSYTHVPCVYVDLRTARGIDVTDYPDSGKLNILPSMQVFDAGAKVDYFAGEEDVEAKWSDEILNPNLA
jgi:uncharacterized cupin superfamily protein